MARHGIFIGSQKIIARYIGDNLVWKVKEERNKPIYELSGVQAIAILSDKELLLSFPIKGIDSDRTYASVNIDGVDFKILKKAYATAENIGFYVEGDLETNREKFDKAGFFDATTYRIKRNVTVKLYDTLDAQPVVPEPQPEKPVIGNLAWEGNVTRVRVFSGEKFLDMSLYHDNQVPNEPYKAIEINGVLFPLKNVRSYGTSYIGLNGEGGFTSKKDDLTKAGFSIDNSYRQVATPHVKLYK